MQAENGKFSVLSLAWAALLRLTAYFVCRYNGNGHDPENLLTREAADQFVVAQIAFFIDPTSHIEGFERVIAARPMRNCLGERVI